MLIIIVTKGIAQIVQMIALRNVNWFLIINTSAPLFCVFMFVLAIFNNQDKYVRD